MTVTDYLLSWIVYSLGCHVSQYDCFFCLRLVSKFCSFWFQFQEEAKYPTKKHVFHNLVPYGAGVLLGISGSILLVTSLSMTADLIDRHVVSDCTTYSE